MKSVFLTGATGTIGSALVPRLLRDDSVRLSLLIRARDDAEVRTRLDEMRGYWGYVADGAQAARIVPMRGDIALPDFGLQPQTLDRLAAETTHIIHCAASVKLNMPIAQAQATAVLPTRTVLALGRRAAAAGSLQKIDLVSTVGVWGRTPGLMPERRLDEVGDFHNTYEAAKAEAERVVWTEGDGLPITVHRPSMVVGERGTGRVRHFQVFYHLCEFLSGARTFGIMPALGETRLDTVPVDWVADAICWANGEPQNAGRILHLCSGSNQAIALPALQRMVRDTWQAHDRRLPKLRSVDRAVLERLMPVVGLFAGAKGRRALRGLPPVLAYLAEDQGFSNDGTARTLAAAGLPVPAPQDYLADVLGFYLDCRRDRTAP